MKKLNNPTENFVSKRINQRRVRRWVALLSALVLFLTVNTLKLEADTLERIATCGIEQHVHDESCYDASGALICGLAEHAHTDACFQQRPQRHDLTRVDGFMPLNAKVTLATPMPRLASNSANGQDAEQVDIDYYSDIPTEVGSGIEPPVDEIQTELAGEEAAPAVEDAVPLEIVYEDQVEETVQQPEYVINGSTVLLSDILSALGMKVSGIQSAGELEGDTLAETPVNFAVEATQNDYELRVLRDFDAADLAVMTDDEVIIITLKNGIAPVEDNDDENPSENDDINIEETHTGETDDEAAAEETVDEETEDSADEATEKTVDELTKDTDDAETEEAADETTVDATEEETVETVEETETAAVVPDKLVALDFADYDCLADATVYFYAPDRGAVLVNAEELAEADGVHLTVNAPVVLSMEADLGLAELEAALEEAPEDIDARIGENPVLFENGVLIISGDGELTVNGVTYSVTNVTLPSRSVESDNITISTVDDQATLLGVTPAFEDNGEDEGDIYALFAAQMDENIVTATSEEIQVDAIEPAKGLLRSSAMMAAEDAAPEAEEAVADAEETVEETGETETAEAAVETRTLKVRVYDVSLIREGESVEPDAPIHVETTFDAPLEGENFQLYHIVDGKPEEVDGFVKTDDQGRAIGMSFDTASLSPFAVVYYTVEYTTDNNEVTVKLDFTDVVNNGVVFDANSVITALNDGVSVSISELEQGYIEGTDSVVNGELYIDYTTADNKNENIKNVNWIGFNVVSADDGLTVADGKIKVTKDGTVVLSDGISTVTVVISNYEKLVAKELTSQGVDIEVLGGEVPAGSEVSYTALDEAKTSELVEQYNIDSDVEGVAHTAFDVSIAMPEGQVFTEAGEFAVAIDLPVDDKAGNFKLYHIHEGQVEELPVEVVDGKVLFTTNSFSEFVLSYTVDFEYTDPVTGETIAWKWPGQGSYAIADILAEIGVTGEISDVSLVRTIDAGGSEKALYLSEGGSELISEEAFLDTFELSLVVDGKSYTLVITDTARPGYTDLTTLTDEINISVTKATNHVIDGNTITDHESLVANIAYTIQSEGKVNAFKALVQQAKTAGNPNVQLDYDLSSLMDQHDTLVGLTGSGNLKGKGNKNVGTYEVVDGHVLINLLVSEMDGSDTTDANGTLAIVVEIDKTKVTNGGSETYDFPGTSDDLTINWPGMEHGAGSKSVDHNSDTVYPGENGEDYLEYNYTLTVKGGVGLNELKLTDYLPQGMEVKGDITIQRDYVTKTEKRTRDDYGSGSYGAWSNWTTESSTNTTGTPVSVTPSPRNGTFTIDVLNALGLSTADTSVETGNSTTEQTRTNTDSTYTVTYTGRIKKSDAMALIGDGTSTQLTNTATWNKDSTPIPGGEQTVTINKGNLNNGTKAIDGVYSDKMQVAFVDFVDVNGQKYAKISYTVSINEPIDANSAVLTDKLSPYQKLANGSAKLLVNNTEVSTVSLTAAGADASGKGGTITFDLQQALQALNPQQSFTKNTTYSIKYDTLVSVDDFNKSITNETDWTIGNEFVPGEDKTVIVERKPYEPGNKYSKLTDHSVTGSGPWEISWEITTTQHQDVSDVTLTDTFSSDQAVKANSFKIYVGNTEYAVPADASYLHVDNSNHTFSIDFDEALKALVSGLTDPAFKKETQYKVTYTTETTLVDDPNTSEVEKSHNESTWRFDGVDKGPDPADEYLKKEEYKSGDKKVKSEEGTGTGNWTSKETAEVESVMVTDDKLDLSYKIDLSEPMDGISQASLTDTYSNYETVDFDNMYIEFEGAQIPVPSNMITRNDSAKQFTIDYVAVLRSYKNDQNYTLEKNKTYSLRYNTSIELTDNIKELLKQKDANGVITGLTVPNRQTWHFDGPNGPQDVPGEPVEYTFKEKPYNGGTKGFAIYNENGELMDSWATITEDDNHNPVYGDFATTQTPGMKVYFVDSANNTLHYTITLNEHRNATQAILKDTYYGAQTLKADSFTVTFYHNGEKQVVNIPASSITTGTEGTGKTFQFDLVRVLENNNPSYDFTPNIDYVIEYDMDVSALNHTGGTGNSDGTVPTGDGYDNTAHWDFGDGEGEGGKTEIHTDTPELVPGQKTVKVREQVKTSSAQTSDWNYWYNNGNHEQIRHDDNNFTISHVVKEPSECEDGAYHLDYTILIREPLPVTSAVLTDTFKGSAAQTLDVNSFKLFIEGEDEPLVIPSTYINKTTSGDKDTGFTLDLVAFLTAQGKTFKKNTDYRIGFTTTTTVKGNINGSGDGQDNRADWVINETNLDGGHTEAHIKLVTYLDKQYYNVTGVDAANEETVTASGTVNFGDKVKYVITVGKDGDDLRGVWVGDDMWMLQTIDLEKGIIIRDAQGNVLADLTKNPASADYSSSVDSGATTQGNYTKQNVFYFTFPDAKTKIDGPINGPVTITYYVDVVSESDYVSLAGRTATNVPNTAKTLEAEITVDYDLNVGSITMQKDALEIDPENIKANNLTVPWSVTVTPDGTTLKGTKIADFPARFSTASMEDARNATNTTEMSMDFSSVTVTYKNAGNGHAAGDPVPNNMWNTAEVYTEKDHTYTVVFTGDITEAVVVTFNTIATTGYSGGNVYFYNKAVIRDSGNNDITEPDDAENPYEIDGTVTATKTYLSDALDIENDRIWWRITINTTGSATLMDYALVDDAPKYSATEVQDWSTGGTPIVHYPQESDHQNAKIKDAEGNTLVLDTDYTVEQIAEQGYKPGIRFMKRLKGPVTVDIPFTFKAPAGVTYLHNKAVLSDGTNNVSEPEGDGEIENYTLTVDKSIQNNVYPTAPNFDQEVGYEVKLNENKTVLPEGTVKMTDILPDGMEYVTGSFKYLASGTHGNDQTIQNGTEGWYDLSVSADGKTLSYDFPEGVSLNGTYIWVYYKAKLTATEIERLKNIGTNVVQVYDNKITVTQAERVTGEDDSEWDYQWNNGLDKKDVTDDKQTPGLHTPYLYYEIDINPEGRRMNGGKMLVMTDRIETSMELNLNSVEVLDENDDAVEEAKVSYDGITRVLTVRVPDERSCKVTFETKIENAYEGLSKTFTNTAYLKGDSTWSDTEEQEHRVDTTAGTFVYNVEKAFFITKIDGNNIIQKLPGAEFTLYKASFPAMDNLNYYYDHYANYDNDKDTVYYDLTPFVLSGQDATFLPRVQETDKDGEVLFEHLELNTLYYWMETKTSSDQYSAGLFAEPQYVVLFTTNDQAMLDSEAHAKLLDHLISDANGIIVNNAKESYNWTATNFKETQYSVKKIWQDKNNEDGLRPDSIWVQLYQDEAAYNDPNTAENDGLVEIKADNNGDWEYTWYDLPAVKTGGVAYVYSAKELTPAQMLAAGVITEAQKTALEAQLADYSVLYKDVTGGVEITNRKKDETSLLVHKEWDDDNNVSRLRPGYIEVKLYRETLTSSDASEIGQVVQMAPKSADDNTVEVADRTIKIYANDGWVAEFSGLVTAAEGRTYKYFLVEMPVTGYIPTYNVAYQATLSGGTVAAGTPSEDGVISISNKLDVVMATKKWLDENGDETWVKDVTFKLMKKTAGGNFVDVQKPAYFVQNNLEWSQTIKTDTDNRTAIWEHLDELGENEAYFAIEYEIQDVEASAINRNEQGAAMSFTLNGKTYDVTGGTSSSGTGTIINAPRVEKEFTKTWENTVYDDSDTTNNRKNLTVEIQLQRINKANGQVDTAFNNDAENHPEGQVITLDYNTSGTKLTVGGTTVDEVAGEDTDATWTYKWSNLPLTEWSGENDESIEYVYEVVELKVLKDGVDVTRAFNQKRTDSFAITNEYNGQIIKISKKWLPEPQNDWSITANLLVRERLYSQDGDVLATPGVPSDWEAYADLPSVTFGKNSEGVSYDEETGKYTLELSLPHYRTDTQNNRVYELEFKAEEDESALDADYILVDTVIDGNDTIFTNESKYVVVEVEKKWDPKPDPTDNPSVTVQLKRYMLPLPKTEATVKKIWIDDNDRDGIRPNSLDVTLSNGQTVTLNEGNGWTATISNLEQYENEQQVSYTWTEPALPAGYSLTKTSETGNITLLVNTHEIETVSASIALIWDDENNKDGVRPASVTATLSNGNTATLNAENEWRATISNLPKNENGSPITYTWSVDAVNDYEKRAENYSQNASLTLFHEPTLPQFMVTVFTGDYGPQDVNKTVYWVISGGSVTIEVTTSGTPIVKWWNKNNREFGKANGYNNDPNNVLTNPEGEDTGNGVKKYTYTISNIMEEINIGVSYQDNQKTRGIEVSVNPPAGKLNAPRKLMGERNLAKAPAVQPLGATPEVTHTNASPAEAPEGYVNDGAFEAQNITLTLNDTDGWKQSFAQQPKTDFLGRPYYYYVVETQCTPSEDYWIEKYEGDLLNSSGTIRITNRKEAEYGSLKVKKQAVGLTDSTKSFKIAVKDASGSYYGQNGQVVTGDARWVTFNAGEEKLWSNLPVDISTHSTTYIVEEDTEDANINGLTLEVEGSGVSVNVAKDNTASHTVINTYTKEFEATKEWYDGDTGAKITDFTGFTGTATLELVQYYRNGSEEVATGTTYDVKLDGTVDAASTGDNYESAAWTAKWTKLPATGTVSSATVEYFYKAREKAATKDTLTMADMVVVVNAQGTVVQNYLPTEHTVVKQWPFDWMLDNTEIEFTLTAGANPHKVEKKVRMNKNGVVSIDGVAATEAQKADGTISTYKVKPEDAEETGKKWQYVWKNLPAGYVDGNTFVKYEYAVTEKVYYTGTNPETEVTNLYKQTTDTNTAGTTVFTNIPKSKAVTVNKVWSNDLPTGMVITSVEYELRYKAYAYGKDKTAENLVEEGVVASDATRTLTPDGGEWKAVTLDKTLNTYGWVTKDGKSQLVELVYEAVETSVKGRLNASGEEEELIGYFTTEASGQDSETERSLTMTNTYAPRKVQVEKIWKTLDGETITENLPKIKIRLVRHAKDQEGNVVMLKTGDDEALIDGGREIGEIELDGQTDEKETIAWKYTWNDLPKSGYETNADGEKLFCNFEYGVKEDTVEGYTMSLVKLDAEQYVVDVKTKKSGAANDDTFIIRNTMMPSYELPSTGGPGTTGLYIVGSILTLLALVLLITKKRCDGTGID